MAPAVLSGLHVVTVTHWAYPTERDQSCIGWLVTLTLPAIIGQAQGCAGPCGAQSFKRLFGKSTEGLLNPTRPDSSSACGHGIAAGACQRIAGKTSRYPGDMPDGQRDCLLPLMSEPRLYGRRCKMAFHETIDVGQCLVLAGDCPPMVPILLKAQQAVDDALRDLA